MRLILLCALLLPQLSHADPSFDLSLLPELAVTPVQKNAAGDQYKIGDRITLQVEIKPDQALAQSGLPLAWSLKVPEGSSKLEDQGWYLDPNPQFLSGNLRFVISPIQIGKLTLPTLLIFKNTEAPIARTAPWSIQAAGPENPDQEKPDLLDPTAIPLALQYWILLGVITLLLLTIVAILIRRYLAKKRLLQKLPKMPREIVLLEHERALLQIKKLYETSPYQEDHLKPIAFGISECFKAFCSERFKIDGRESTTDELLRLLEREALPREELRELRSLLTELDFIKFTQKQKDHAVSEAEYLGFRVRAENAIKRWARVRE